MLESPPPEPPRQAAAQAASRSAESAHENSVRRDPRGGRAAKANVPDVVHEARPSRGRARARSRLGADGDVLPVPARALEASADVEPGGVALRGGAAADGRGQAIQEGRERDGGDLEDAAHRREDVPTPRRAGIARRRREWSHVRQRSSRSEPTHRGRRRLISFTHFLTRPRIQPRQSATRSGAVCGA